jgi:transcriptional regulator with XRE-family HTH domain
MNNIDNINEYVGKALRNIRHNKKISLQDMAEKLNVSYQQVQKYETGVNRLGADTLYELANLLNVDVRMFFPNTQISEPNFSDSQMKFLISYESIQDEKIKELFFLLIQRISSLDIH